MLMNILITGGAGYIGSHAVRCLSEKGHAVVVLDDLSNGHRESLNPKIPFHEGSIANAGLVEKILVEHSIEAVMNFAAFIEVGESVLEPYKYYENNFSSAVKLLQVMGKCNVKKFVFSSTAAVYGTPQMEAITEDHPKNPLSPYGRSKLMVEQVLPDFARSFGMGYAVLRYFNVAGAHPDSTIGEAHHPETHLIPKVLSAAQGSDLTLPIYGTAYPTRDGTCVRDYVHVQDIVAAHALALENIVEGEGNFFNIGSQKGFSVLEVIEACKSITGRKINVENHAPRAGDPPTLVANSTKIRAALKWVPEFPDLKIIIQHAWNWHQAHPRGYQK